MKRYLAYTRMTYLLGLVWRLPSVFTLTTNLFYIVVVYFLWRNIYGSSDSLHGMSFPQTFTYLALASSIFVLFKTFTDWAIARDIINGAIAVHLTKPIDLQLRLFFEAFGSMLTNLTLIGLPTLLVLVIFFPANLVLGINVLMFAISVLLAFILSFLIDYMVGLSGFYTESIWGIGTAKEITVLVLSGAMLPLRFFPEGMQIVLRYLPFQAIYNTPISIITDRSLTTLDMITMLGIQTFWIAVLFMISRLFYEQAVKVVTINGG
jgi:ABC-2 type transport system permease protein